MKKEADCAMNTRARSTFGTQMRPVEPNSRPIVWSIAGSDSGGGAGLQADLKALHAFGVHGGTAVAAITAQNSRAVSRVEPVSPALLDAQLAALAQDMPPQAIKTGLLGSAENVKVVCQWVDRVRAVARAQGFEVPLVVDPVLGATTGAAFADAAILQAYVTELLPRATLITPNRLEAQRLLAAASSAAVDVVAVDAEVTSGGGIQGLARALLRCMAPGASILITGGDASADEGMAADWLHSPHATGWLSLPRVATPHHHGTGCTFASTAAAALASGYCTADAVVLAKMASTHALRHAYAAGQGAGPVCPQADFAQHIDNLPALSLQPHASVSGVADAAIPLVSSRPVPTAPLAFPTLQPTDMGVYAVVDSAAWVGRVLAAGIRTVQLRIKDPAEPTLAVQIQAAIAIACQTPGAQLFINDHWQLALRHGAYGVHLGQEDLEHVDLDALRSAGVCLGLSTHSYWEVARAWALQPSYIAIGPVFATHSKDMPWIPQGLDNLRYWASVLPLPVVGIAGIGIHNVAEVAATGAASAAVITAITQAVAPEVACQKLQAAFARRPVSLL